MRGGGGASGTSCCDCLPACTAERKAAAADDGGASVLVSKRLMRSFADARCVGPAGSVAEPDVGRRGVPPDNFLGVGLPESMPLGSERSERVSRTSCGGRWGTRMPRPTKGGAEGAKKLGETGGASMYAAEPADELESEGDFGDSGGMASCGVRLGGIQLSGLPAGCVEGRSKVEEPLEAVWYAPDILEPESDSSFCKWGGLDVPAAGG